MPPSCGMVQDVCHSRQTPRQLRMNRAIRFCAGLGIVMPALVVMTPVEATAQTCTILPAQSNEVWVAATIEGGQEEPRGGARFLFNVRDLVVLAGDASLGGYDTGAGSARSYGAQLSAPSRVAGLAVCPTVGVARTGYSFLERFGSQRGEVVERSFALTVPVGGLLPRLAGSELGWWIAPRSRIDSGSWPAAASFFERGSSSSWTIARRTRITSRERPRSRCGRVGSR